ncbi:MAG TPA: nicotinamide riboside transporter PnuC [Sphingomicrobium sp.]|nr:nicotinamide riboside transporter PnuC [Sphingomicrobium sp.]
MSKLEALAALLGIVNVALVARRSIWNYPPGIAMVALYFFVFFQAKLYSDALLQIFFLVIQLYGWWNWLRSPRRDDGVAVEWMAPRQRIAWLCGTVAFALCWGLLMRAYTDAAAPLIDANIAGFSVAAQLLLSLRRVENWILWVGVDLVAVALFAWRGLAITAGLYAVFLCMSAIGLVSWIRRASPRVAR